MRTRESGFSLVEVLVSLTIFLIVSAAVFELLNASQIRYKAEQEFLESFQGARLGLELMIRDIHNTGYPPPYTYAGNLPQQPTGPTPLFYPAGIWSSPGAAPADIQRRFAMGVVGIKGGVVDPTCTVNGGANPCTIPNAFDLVLELDVDPENLQPDMSPQVEWVRYDLRGPAGDGTSTLYRTVNPKAVGTSPTANPSLVPFVEEIYSVPQVAGDTVQNPTQPVSATNLAVFTYTCALDKRLGTPPTNTCLATDVQDVTIALRVQSTRRDLQTGQFRRITVQGMARRMNPGS